MGQEACGYPHNSRAVPIAAERLRLNRAGRGGMTAVHLAAFHGYSDNLRLLLEAGADPNAICDDGETPLHTACTGGSILCATLLLDHGECWWLFVLLCCLVNWSVAESRRGVLKLCIHNFDSARTVISNSFVFSSCEMFVYFSSNKPASVRILSPRPRFFLWLCLRLCLRLSPAAFFTHPPGSVVFSVSCDRNRCQPVGHRRQGARALREAQCGWAARYEAPVGSQGVPRCVRAYGTDWDWMATYE